MCGIVGYVGDAPCEEMLLAGLEALEYRGYDSAGLSLQRDGAIERVRSVGNLAALRDAVARERGGVATLVRTSTTGIGHTRWATHGGVSEENAHPHCDMDGRIHIALNGIVENHAALRSRLAEQHLFISETDAEVVAHLIAHHYDGDLERAVRAACTGLEGHYAFVAMSADEPELLVAARKECPLVVGVAQHGRFVASAISAFQRETTRVQDLRDGEVLAVTRAGARFTSAGGAVRRRSVATAAETAATADRNGFETYMLKEIHEQPDAIAATLQDRLSDSRPSPDLGVPLDLLRRLESITIVGCGSSYHAALAGRDALEQWAQVPVEVEIASEYRYRPPVSEARDLVIGITQSGETADTLAAMRLCRKRGAFVLALTNVAGSQATREADGVLLTHAGLEVGVAATKTYACQVVALWTLALRLAEARQTIMPARRGQLAAEILRLPGAIERLLRDAGSVVRRIADRYADAPFFLYLGRGAGLPTCLEGALKLKEISYIPTDAYAAGEMKHGPIALLSPGTPVVCVATDDRVLDKTASNIAEVQARGADVLAIATQGHKELAEQAEEIVYVPQADPLLAALLALVPLQLLAYAIARRRGLNVDQPRNLAKTVTVE